MSASKQVFLDDAAMMATLDAMGGTAPVTDTDDEHRAKIDAIWAKHAAEMKARADKHEALMAEFAAASAETQEHLVQARLLLSVPVLTFNEAMRRELGFGLLTNNAR